MGLTPSTVSFNLFVAPAGAVAYNARHGFVIPNSNGQEAGACLEAFAMPQMKPTAFIGSSSKGKNIADHLQLGLSGRAYCTVWDQGVFGLSQGNLENLVQAT